MKTTISTMRLSLNAHSDRHYVFDLDGRLHFHLNPGEQLDAASVRDTILNTVSDAVRRELANYER